MQSSNARRFRRLPSDVRVFTRGTWVPFAEDARDVSEGGVGIVTARPLPVGTRALFALALPHREQVIELRGTVVWAGQGAMGVAFEHHHPMLNDYVDRLSKAEDSI